MKSNITLHLDLGAVLIGDKEVDVVGYDLPKEDVWYKEMMFSMQIFII
jgi:hypothetical protein